MLEFVEIKGFKSIKEVRMGLNPLNILIGGNGSGKSNFITFFQIVKIYCKQAIAAIFDGRRCGQVVIFRA